MGRCFIQLFTLKPSRPHELKCGCTISAGTELRQALKETLSPRAKMPSAKHEDFQKGTLFRGHQSQIRERLLLRRDRSITKKIATF